MPQSLHRALCLPVTLFNAWKVVKSKNSKNSAGGIDGLLTEPTKRILIERLLERLNRYENYRGENLRLEDIIQRQVQEIAAFISGESKTFKPYLAKW